MAEKVTIMKLKVDLQCNKCYKKVKRVLCKFPQIRDQLYDQKNNIVTITVVCCNPEKLRDKLCCKGCGTIKSIEIVEPPKPKPPPPEKPKAKPPPPPTRQKPPSSPRDPPPPDSPLIKPPLHHRCVHHRCVHHQRFQLGYVVGHALKVGLVGHALRVTVGHHHHVMVMVDLFMIVMVEADLVTLAVVNVYMKITPLPAQLCDISFSISTLW